MKAPSKSVVTGVIGFVLGSVVSAQLVRGQAPATKIDGMFTHVSLAVRDADATGKALAELFGLPVPTSRIVKSIPFPDRYGNKTMSGRVSGVMANGVRIEIIQPLDDSPWKDFIDKHGEGVHHVGWNVSDWPAAVKFLESKGGVHTQGSAKVNFGYVDLSALHIPFSMEVVGEGGAKLPPQ
jgi:hypothetical protein